MKDEVQPNLPLVLPLHALGRNDLAIAGGKGANLGELIRGGFPVPPGFVVSTAAYDSFVSHNNLEQVIASSLSDISSAGAIIRGAFEAAPIPPEIEREVVTAYRQLGAGPVAIRSSATAEDLPEATFAGQQDTYLNIISEEAILDAVRRCWASLWTDRAIAYRARQQVMQATVKLAVVVQHMVAAEAAGVMFTANPVTGERDDIVIDATPGLGEAIVSGLVTPDHVVLSRRLMQIKQQSRGRREIIIRGRPEGGTEHIEGKTLGARETLPEKALSQLAKLGIAIEQHFGLPQDIEWAWAGGALFIVQSRPMTALPEPPPHVNRMVSGLAATLAEVFAVRPYPLDETTWTQIIFTNVLGPMAGLIGAALPSHNEMFPQEDGVIMRFNEKAAPRPTLAMMWAPARFLWLAVRNNPAHARTDSQLVEAQHHATELELRDLKAMSWPGLLSTVREVLALALPLTGQPRVRYLPRPLLAAGSLRLMLALLKSGDHFGVLLSGVESETLEANRALESLAARVRADSALSELFAYYTADQLRARLGSQPTGRAFLSELQSFMDRYGHRDTTISSALPPTWKDAPELVLGMIKGFAQTEPRTRRASADWEAARDEMLTHSLLQLSPIRSVFLKLLRTARYLWQVRENSHFDLTRILPGLRRTLLEMGRRLVEIDVLPIAEDVFHLKFDELERIGNTWPPSPELADELRGIATRRKAKRAPLEGKPVIDPRLYRQTAPSGDALLHGVAGSPGVAEGPVRIIRNSSEFGKLRAGEILVAPYTNPSWTPLFQRAIAVVVDAGSSGSHAAIVAREYGIPAVMGSFDGTQRLVDGQRVRVDGNRGLVLPAAPIAA